MIRRITMMACAVLLAVGSASCGTLGRGVRGGGGGGGGGGSAGLSSQCRGDFGASAAAGQFEAFMSATWQFHEAAMSAQSTLLDACRRMGGELGMPGEQLAGEGPEATSEVCNAVAAQLRLEMSAIREGSQTTVEVQATPPRCRARFEAYADCAARCDVSVDRGQLEIQCEGGEVRGRCSGQCSGRCAVEVQARCEGTCEGACDGQCAAHASDGTCAGRCDGTCRGECVADARAGCEGECRGECSVEWQEPYCTTAYAPPQVSAECRAACDAEVQASLECEPGRAELVVSGGPSGAELERIERVRRAVQTGLGMVEEVRYRMQRLQQTGAEVLAQLRDLPDAIREVGVGAAACSAAAVSDLQQSIAATNVTASVTVTVSASVSVEGG